ncbi:MAG TPA: UvrD-helicase domain-containing protein [Xanthobacteraceae bacterium]|nr:UvrD-helicase domain-containing protein [Xanthobacteraceae bacterium]
MADPAQREPAESTDFSAPAPGGIAARALAGRAGGAAYLADLNPEQRRAVETLDGPVLVLAGAGTGKTRVLTTRIAHILATGRAYPSQILAVTFTNKAAREMKERVGQMVGQVVEGMPWLGTFHAIGVKILRRHAELVGLKSDFTILDEDDQVRLIKQLLEAENIDDKKWPARVFAGMLDHWKNRGLTPDQVPSGEGAVFANGRGKKLYQAYQERLKTLNAVDFGDLLLECIRLFRENPEVLRQYQDRFKFILVDEYQDTNVAQYLWLRLLAQRTSLSSPPAGEGTEQKNICCVGDDDQSIYGWRGAEVDNILRFEHDFPGAKIVRLERNYRSTGHILATAAHLIAHNQGRLGKTLHTEDVDGEKVTVTACWDSEEEARAIGEEIESLHRQGHALDEIAILVRASFQMREFEDRFVTLGLPYRVIGGPRFYERAEIRDALAYLRVIHSPSDDLAFERIVNVPKRGLGDASVQVLHDYARKHRVPLTEAARVVVETDSLGAKARSSLRGLLEGFSRWRSQNDSLPHNELAEIVLDESGYTEMWQKDRSPDAPGRLDNLKELVRSMEEFENLAGFLEHISLVMDTDSDASADAVNIMTLHAAKGLEFDTVFLPGWEETVFPNQRSLDEQGRAGLEEERRLAHVGITRARKRAKIFFATNRRTHGLWQTNIPSRFLDELPPANVEVAESKAGFGAGGNFGGPFGPSRFDQAASFGSDYGSPGWQRAQKRRGGFSEDEQSDFADAAEGGRMGTNFQRNARRRHGPLTVEGELVAKSTGTVSAFSPGDRVFHQKFGNGNVVAVDGNKLTIAFDKAGEKRVVDSFVERV